MHDVGTGNGIMQATREHKNLAVVLTGLSFETGLRESSEQDPDRASQGSPLTSTSDARWRFSHASRNAISAAPRQEAMHVVEKFEKLKREDPEAIIVLLKSL